MALETAYFVASFGVAPGCCGCSGIAVPDFTGDHWREITVLGIMPTLLVVHAGHCRAEYARAHLRRDLRNAGAVHRPLRTISAGRACGWNGASVNSHSLTAIGQAVANSLELPEVLEAIHQQTQRLMDARNFYIALYDETERRINFPLAYENDERVTYTSRLFGEGFTEYMILTRQPLLIKRDVRSLPTRSGSPSFDPQVQSWLGVPIAIGERVLGVMAVQSRAAGQCLRRIPSGYFDLHRRAGRHRHPQLAAVHVAAPSDQQPVHHELGADGHQRHAQSRRNAQRHRHVAAARDGLPKSGDLSGRRCRAARRRWPPRTI